MKLLEGLLPARSPRSSLRRLQRRLHSEIARSHKKGLISDRVAAKQRGVLSRAITDSLLLTSFQAQDTPQDWPASVERYVRSRWELIGEG